MEYPPITGGGASYTKNLITQLIKLKIKIVLITSGSEDSVDKINNYLTIKRFKVFEDLYYDKGGFIQGVDVLMQQIRDESPDILHTVYIEESLIGQIANLNYGIPHIVTHTKTPMYREESIIKNSTWSTFDYVNRSKLVTFVAPGIAYRDSLLQSGIKENAIRLIYPGIDRTIFKKNNNQKTLDSMRKRLNISKKEFVILIPCMLRKRKGLYFVSEALSKLSIPNSKIKIIVTGLPQNQDEELIYQSFKKLKGDIEFVEHGWFTDEDMPILYNIADITVLCSEAEGYGTVFLEAMACECPVIGSDVVGINGLITNHFDGILCKYGDCKSLNDAITEVLTDSTTCKKLIKNALWSLKFKYNLQKQANDHLNLYKSFLNIKQASYCIAYRLSKNEVEILLENSRKKLSVPKTTKRINESWLQAAIKKTREISEYQVVIPSHQVFDETNHNIISYSFKIKDDTSVLGLSKQKKSTTWMQLNKAILLVDDDDKKVLKKLRSFIKNDLDVKTIKKTIKAFN